MLYSTCIRYTPLHYIHTHAPTQSSPHHTFIHTHPSPLHTHIYTHPFIAQQPGHHHTTQAHTTTITLRGNVTPHLYTHVPLSTTRTRTPTLSPPQHTTTAQKPLPWLKVRPMIMLRVNVTPHLYTQYLPHPYTQTLSLSHTQSLPCHTHNRYHATPPPHQHHHLCFSLAQ